MEFKLDNVYEACVFFNLLFYPKDNNCHCLNYICLGKKNYTYIPKHYYNSFCIFVFVYKLIF